MLVGEALRQAATRLRNEGVDSPRLDAELLLAHVLGANRATVLAWPDRRLTPKELTKYRSLVSRRADREPLAYILGYREFYGLKFAVDSRALIPRPETELLVEHALRVAQRLERHDGLPLQIADVGSGSGAIAVTLAVHLSGAMIYALDESMEALALTAENARRHGVVDRVQCLPGDLLMPLPSPVDLITANLPYVATDEWEDLSREIRTYEPRTALHGGPNGLEPIRRLLAMAGPYLHAGGAILMEIGARQGAKVTALARRSFPRAIVHLYQDYAGLDRVVAVETVSE